MQFYGTWLFTVSIVTYSRNEDYFGKATQMFGCRLYLLVSVLFIRVCVRACVRACVLVPLVVPVPVLTHACIYVRAFVNACKCENQTFEAVVVRPAVSP